MFVRECNTKGEIRDFLSLSKKSDNKLELQLIKGKHTLSKDFKVKAFIAYNANGFALARCIVTLYDEDGNAYIGLFESVNNNEVCKALMNKVEEYARESGKTKLVGPVDASFWIKYRFKVDSANREFEDTYTGEPYNKIYYSKLWEECGFKVSKTYKSNMYRQVIESDKSEKSELRLRQMKEKGYKFRNSSFMKFNNDLKEIYYLMCETYNKFPCYKQIKFKQFKKMYRYLRYVLNYSMTWIVHKDNKTVGFFICIPNYERIKGIVEFIKIRKNPKEYVMLYMGVEKEHLGLGSALAELTKKELYNNKCTSIGALIQDGKATNVYYKGLIVGNTEYVLLEKGIDT